MSRLRKLFRTHHTEGARSAKHLRGQCNIGLSTWIQADRVTTLWNPLLIQVATAGLNFHTCKLFSSTF